MVARESVPMDGSWERVRWSSEVELLGSAAGVEENCRSFSHTFEGDQQTKVGSSRMGPEEEREKTQSKSCRALGEKKSSERASQEEQNGANFSQPQQG